MQALSTPTTMEDSQQNAHSNNKIPEPLRKLAELSLSPDASPVLVPMTPQDVDLWKDFIEYKENRKSWDTWREEDWKKNHPAHIHEIFNNWPVLETPRLRLRLLRESDLQDAFNVLSNPKAMKYYGTPPHENIEFTRKQHIEIMLSRFKFRDAASFVITFKGEDKFIGHVNAFQFDRVFKFVELAYIVDPELWGKGIATEAVGRVVEFLRDDMKIHKIRAALFAHNIASKRVLEKVGFVQEGYLRDNVIIDGEFENEYVMAYIASKESM